MGPPTKPFRAEAVVTVAYARPSSLASKKRLKWYHMPAQVSAESVSLASKPAWLPVQNTSMEAQASI